MSRAVAVIIFTLISVIYDEEVVVDAVLTLLTRVGLDYVTILNRILKLNF